MASPHFHTAICILHFAFFNLHCLDCRIAFLGVRLMKIFLTRFSILLLAALGGCGSSGDLTDIDVPLPEQQPRALADQYRAAAERQRSEFQFNWPFTF